MARASKRGRLVLLVAGAVVVLGGVAALFSWFAAQAAAPLNKYAKDAAATYDKVKKNVDAAADKVAPVADGVAGAQPAAQSFIDYQWSILTAPARALAGYLTGE